MLPIVWFYIAAVVFLWGLLVYTEFRKQARGHVKGCSALPYISPERLNSLIIIEPDLRIVALGAQPGEVCIPDAYRMPLDELKAFVNHTSRSAILVLYTSASNPVDWKEVERLIRHSTLRNVFVLCGGLDAWLSWKNATPAESGQFVSPHRLR